MDTMIAFAMGQANKDKERMVFDWNKAARLIKEKKVKNASAGLRADWEWTGGEIFRDGKPLKREDSYTYLASTWAVPEIEIDGVVYDCYVMESKIPKSWKNKYDKEDIAELAGLFWPKSALRILEKK